MLRLFCWSSCIKQTKCTFASLARLVFMKGQRRKDLLLQVRIVITPSHLNIWRRHLADYVKKLHQKARVRSARLFFLIQPIKSLICGFVVAVVVCIVYSRRCFIGTSKYWVKIKNRTCRECTACWESMPLLIKYANSCRLGWCRRRRRRRHCASFLMKRRQQRHKSTIWLDIWFILIRPLRSVELNDAHSY